MSVRTRLMLFGALNTLVVLFILHDLWQHDKAGAAWAALIVAAFARLGIVVYREIK